MNLAILGPQGSGKGTQAEKLVKEFGFAHIETGKILREIAQSDHPLANHINNVQISGGLVDDGILEQVLTEKLAKASESGYLFDGTPRNLTQYELLKYLLSLLGEKLDKIIYLNISEAEIVKRSSSRRTCAKCGRIYNLITNPPPVADKCECLGELILRDDDQPEIIKKRLAKFIEATRPVIEKARSEGILIEIDGEKPIEEIHQEIINKLT